MSTKKIAMGGLIAAIYVILTLMPPFSSIAFGMIQFRVSELLMVFCLFTPAGVVGTTLGCLIANLMGAANLFDIIFGTLATFLAGLTMYRMRNSFMRRKFLMPIPVVVFNALIVGLYLPFVLSGNASIPAVFGALFQGTASSLIAQGIAPVGICMLSIAVGEAAVMYILGIPFSILVEKKKLY